MVSTTTSEHRNQEDNLVGGVDSSSATNSWSNQKSPAQKEIRSTTSSKAKGAAAAAATAVAKQPASSKMTAGWTKTKKRKKTRASDLPKRPLSAYNFFFHKEREIVLSERIGAKEDRVGDLFVIMGKTIGKRWRKLTTQQRKKYDALAKKDSIRYYAQLKEYNLRKEMETRIGSKGDRKKSEPESSPTTSTQSSRAVGSIVPTQSIAPLVQPSGTATPAANRLSGPPTASAVSEQQLPPVSFEAARPPSVGNITSAREVLRHPSTESQQAFGGLQRRQVAGASSRSWDETDLLLSAVNAMTAGGPAGLGTHRQSGQNWTPQVASQLTSLGQAILVDHLERNLLPAAGLAQESYRPAAPTPLSCQVTIRDNISERAGGVNGQQQNQLLQHPSRQSAHSSMVNQVAFNFVLRSMLQQQQQQRQRQQQEQMLRQHAIQQALLQTTNGTGDFLGSGSGVEEPTNLFSEMEILMSLARGPGVSRPKQMI